MTDRDTSDQESKGGGRKAAIERQAQLRRDRAAEKLRENLRRRKDQTRARRQGEADDTVGLPAAKMDES